MGPRQEEPQALTGERHDAPKPSVLLLETVEVGEPLGSPDSASESLASFKLLGRSSF